MQRSQYYYGPEIHKQLKNEPFGHWPDGYTAEDYFPKCRKDYKSDPGYSKLSSLDTTNYPQVGFHPLVHDPYHLRDNVDRVHHPDCKCKMGDSHSYKKFGDPIIEQFAGKIIKKIPIIGSIYRFFEDIFNLIVTLIIIAIIIFFLRIIF